jgi:hypothetical protein
MTTFFSTRNLDNIWNETNLAGCRKAKEGWFQLVSRSKNDIQQMAGREGYECVPTKDEADGKPAPYPEPKWPEQTLDELIERAFEGRMILTEEHPGLARVIGHNPLAT